MYRMVTTFDFTGSLTGITSMFGRLTSLSLLAAICLLGVTGTRATADIESDCVVTGVSPGSYLNVRDEPTKTGRKVGQIAASETTVQRLGATYSSKSGNWTRIKHQSHSGWASSDFLNCASSSMDDIRLTAAGTKILSALADRDMQTLSNLVHPTRGLRLSPYAFVDTETDRVVQAKEIVNLSTDQTSHSWGYYDGSGELILGTFSEYFGKFVWSDNFIDAHYVSVDTVIRTGNTVDNSEDVYPDARLIDYHVLPKSDANIDWKSLRLVLEEFQGHWLLIGLIHNEWTT